MMKKTAWFFILFLSLFGVGQVVITWTDRSSTVTVGGTSQQLAAANTSRKALLIENPTSATEDLFINFGAAASTTDGKSIDLAAGGSFSSQGTTTSLQQVNVTAVTGGHAFIAKEGQ